MDETPKESRYHHGDLRAALLQAGEAELAANGRLGFTLRGTAKRAGVSHAAPAHHFRDANALLAALAARGFRRLEAAMREAQANAPPDPRAQLIAAGVGYFRFGYNNPALLQLMFGPELNGDHGDAELQAASGASFDLLSRLSRPMRIRSRSQNPPAGRWSPRRGRSYTASPACA
jgi:AcrR family transcriptional regulator